MSFLSATLSSKSSREERDERDVEEAEGRGESEGETAAEDSSSVVDVTVRLKAGFLCLDAAAPDVVAEAMVSFFTRYGVGRRGFVEVGEVGGLYELTSPGQSWEAEEEDGRLKMDKRERMKVVGRKRRRKKSNQRRRAGRKSKEQGAPRTALMVVVSVLGPVGTAAGTNSSKSRL